MSKKFVSLLLSITILVGCFSMGFSPVVTQARDVGVGTGAESFNPVKISVGKEVLIGTDVNSSLNVEVTDKNYKVRINSIKASMPFYDESGSSENLNISYTAGTVVAGAVTFSVTGTIADNINSVVRYIVEYDLLDKKDNVVWKNLTGYTYAFVSSRGSTTGAIGTNYPYPGQLSDGCYFEVLETLNTTYVQQSELALLYKIRTQSAWNYHDPRTRGVNVISGNAPSTLVMMPDNTNASRQGQMNWPQTGAVYRSESADWLRMSEPVSGYYNFTISFNSWNDDWEDQSNITETTEMYYIRNADRVATYDAANKIMKTTNTFADGFYVQKGLYTAESWDNFINAIDMAYQVALSVPNANFGYKIACQNALSAATAVDVAFASLQRAEHDFETYKDVEIVEATCTEKGSKKYTCICGETKVIEVPALGHEQGRWQLSKAATCTETGLDELICLRCNAVIESRILSKIAHEYDLVITPPTCTKKGFTTCSCINCSDAYTRDYVDATGHSWVHVITEPTCTERGYTTHTCNNCDYKSVNMYVDALGHAQGDAVVEYNIDATCTTDGSYDSVVYCTTCKEELSREKITVDAMGHNYGDAVKENEVPATRDEDGSYDSVVYCVTCNEELSREKIVVPALGHEPAETVVENMIMPTCESSGSYDEVIYCTCCVPAVELSRETIVVNATGHSYETAVTPPTCTEDGYTTYTCLICGEIKLDDVVKSPGHTEGEWVVTKEAEFEVAGEETLYCKVCGEAYETKEIPAITAYFRKAEGSTTVIDKENGIIYGLEEGISDLEGFVEYEGGTLKYVKTAEGFGTGTVVNFVVNGKVFDGNSYTIVIVGDVTGDGVIDTLDTTMLAEIVNGDLEVDEVSAVYFAADVDDEFDGAVDTIDLTKLFEVVNGDTTISQTKTKTGNSL